MLRVLRQLRGKDGGELGAIPCRAMPCRATPRGARPAAAFCTTAVNLRLIEMPAAAKTPGGLVPPSFRSVICYSTNCATLTL